MNDEEMQAVNPAIPGSPVPPPAVGRPVLETTKGEPTKAFLADSITHWKCGEQLRLMATAENYYRNRPDIMSRRRTYAGRDGQPVESKALSNTRLRHNYFRSLVKQKVDFLLGKAFSIDCKGNAVFAGILNGFFVNDPMRALLYAEGIHAVAKGIAWAQAYYDGAGNLRFKRIPGEQVIPFWQDDDHQVLDAVIRVYRDRVLLSAGGSKLRVHVEYYTADGCWKYVTDDDDDPKEDSLVQETGGTGPQGHFLNGTVPCAWGRVPFVPFRYSEDEYALIEDVKDLIDDYNECDSDFSNILKDVPNSVKIVKGYMGGPTEKDDWIQKFRLYRMAFVDKDGSVTSLDTPVDSDAYEKRLDIHDKAIYKESRGVNTYGEDFGNASGKALQTRYAPLQNDCEKMGLQFEKAVKEMTWFLTADLLNKGKGDFRDVPFDVVWNMDLVSDESEIIDDVNKSQDLSLRTRLANHPWVKDVDKELSEIRKERKEDAENGASGLFNFKSGGADGGKTDAGDDDDKGDGDDAGAGADEGGD
jgi:SPP1 family phage portal protein